MGLPGDICGFRTKAEYAIFHFEKGGARKKSSLLNIQSVNSTPNPASGVRIPIKHLGV
jgi:hypothetical protein